MPQARILIVEDESIVALDISARLARLGYGVVGMVSSGEEAVTLAGEAHPDLVLMDIRLPGKMDGIEAASQIRSRCDIPVVYVTAHSDEDTLQRAKVTGPFGYVLKPFETRELLAAIEMALYKHRAEQALRGKNQELERRVNELSALNTMFQQHLNMRFEAEERYRELHAAVGELLRSLKDIATHLESKLQTEFIPPSSDVDGRQPGGQPRA